MLGEQAGARGRLGGEEGIGDFPGKERWVEPSEVDSSIV